MTDASPVGMSQATLRIRALQVVAVALIVAAIALLAHGLLTPASPTAEDAGRATPSAGPPQRPRPLIRWWATMRPM